MRVVLDPGAYMPIREHSTDAGLDIKSKDTRIVPAHGSTVFDTGVHVELPSGYAGLLVSKSGLNTKHGITSTGLIDEGYQGSIAVKLYNHTDTDYKVMAGDKISQLVLIKVIYAPLTLVDDFGYTTERNEDGFGSTGR